MDKYRRNKAKNKREKSFTNHVCWMGIQHNYQCDLFIPCCNLIVEADGMYWHNFPFGTEIDKIRTEELRKAGFKVLRFWEDEIKMMTIEDFRGRIGV